MKDIRDDRDEYANVSLHNIVYVAYVDFTEKNGKPPTRLNMSKLARIWYDSLLPPKLHFACTDDNNNTLTDKNGLIVMPYRNAAIYSDFEMAGFQFNFS